MCMYCSSVLRRMVCVEAASQLGWHAQGQLNVAGPANHALIPELAIPDSKLQLFKTACYNPTIAGPQLRNP